MINSPHRNGPARNHVNAPVLILYSSPNVGMRLFCASIAIHKLIRKTIPSPSRKPTSSGDFIGLSPYRGACHAGTLECLLRSLADVRESRVSSAGSEVPKKTQLLLANPPASAGPRSTLNFQIGKGLA